MKKRNIVFDTETTGVSVFDDRVVEIAYGISPSYQRRGFATEAAQALVDFAFATGRVGMVKAHTAPLPNASTHVLQKCGFSFIGAVDDPEDGIVWRWERQNKNT